MFRRWLSGLLSNNKTVLYILALIIAGIMIYLLTMAKLTGDRNGQNNNIIEVYNPSYSIITGEVIPQEELDSDQKVIDEFIGYCNNKEYKNAYELLTDECKEMVYPTRDKFAQNYCDVIFETKKEYTTQSWVNNENYITYRIRYMEDALATGDYSGAEKFQDYITVVNIDGNKKLNIKKYVGREELFRETQTDELTFLVETKDIYIDKEIYTLKVKNKTKKDILLDPLEESTTSIGLVTENDKICRANKYKINSIDFTIGPLLQKEIKLEFANNYGGDSYPVKIFFSNVILDVTEYRNNQENYENRVRVDVRVY